jgi:hypothetical protein
LLSARISKAVLLGCLLAGLAVSPAAASANPPQVGYLSASSVTSSGATIEAPVNPEGAETSYEIRLECQNAERNNQACEPLTVDPQLRQGVLSPGFVPQVVTDVVTGLQSDYLYKYRVVATNSAGSEGYVGDGFVTCPTVGLCPSQPYLAGMALWNIRGAERAAAEAPRLEEERLAKRREAEERPAKEAAERALRERESREAGERAGREAAEREALARRRCLVPHLKGYSLTHARRALAKANCRVGRLIEPRGYREGPLVVVGQSVHGGARLTSGARVGLTLVRGHTR